MNKCYNKPLLSILKIDKDTEKGLAGATFELIDSHGRSKKQVTPAYGLVRFPLYNCERYKLKEIKAPSGYKAFHKTYDVWVDNCGNIFVNGNCTDFLIIKNAPAEESVSIKYLANGGTGEHSETGLPLNTRHTVKTIVEAGITPPENLTFVSWNTEADGSGTNYAPGDIIVLTEDVILYANWSEVRTVMGLVYPTPFDDLGHGDDFLKGFEIKVELRKSYLTPAVDNLKTVAEILYPEETIGRFTFQNVPLGDYVLCIKLDGYLIRCMNVSITESSPDLTLLTPPGGTIFNLWAGDVNNDLVIDELDIDLIEGLENVHYGEPNYIFAADLNYDGVINAADVTLANANIDKTASDYPGAEDVDFNS